MNTNQIMMSSLAVLALSCSSALAAATSGTCGGNCKWELDGSTLKISGSGPMADYTNNAERPWDGLSSSISSVVVSDGITTVGTRAFRDMNNLTSVSIGKNVTSIGNTAFTDNTSLTTVSFSKDSALTNIGTAAFGCNSGKTNQLKEINIPSTVETIGERAFRYSGLQSVNFGDNSQLTTIGEKAFLGNTSLQNVNFGDNSQLTTVGDYAFYQNSSLQSVNFGDNSQLTTIGKSAFYENTSLQSVNFGDNSQLTTIGDYAFYQNSSLQNVDFSGSNLETIGYAAFYENSSLQSVNFGDNSQLTTIGDFAFSGNMKLESVDFGNNSQLTTIGEFAFGHDEKLGTSSDPNTEGSFTIPATVETIGEHAFDGANFDVLIFEEGSQLASIEEGAFLGIYGLIVNLDEVIDLLDAHDNTGNFHPDERRPCDASGDHCRTSSTVANEGARAYCKDVAACEAFIERSKGLAIGQNRQFLEYSYDKKTGRYMSGGKLYASIQDLLSGKFINIRRIYTVEEATEAVSPKGRNTFTIRYR